MVYSSREERLTFQSQCNRANIRDLFPTVVLKIVSDIVAHLYEGHLRPGWNSTEIKSLGIIATVAHDPSSCQQTRRTSYGATTYAWNLKRCTGDGGLLWRDIGDVMIYVNVS